MSDELTIQEGQVVSLEYTLHVDGDEIDTSKGREPLEYLHGSGNIIPGLERELTGMAIGESKSVVVAAADGYGLINEEAFIEVPRGHFPKDMPVEVGTELQVQNQAGEPRYARIDKVEGENVRLNLNHPLAGKDLHFSIEVVSLREATAEEKEHGHAHGAGHQH